MSTTTVPRAKPLGRKAYGSIPHLPGSHLGPGDHHVAPGQARICWEQARDRHDRIIVTEKLDGSNCAVAKIGGEIVPLVRAGYPAASSRFPQHHHFAEWVADHAGRFDRVLQEGERVVGEWLAQAHGTRYALPHEPYVVFDLMIEGTRLPWERFQARVAPWFVTPHVLHDGGPIALADTLTALGPFGHHGALETPEGAVWRVERRGVVDFLAKWVRPDKVDGCYLPEITGGVPIWHWTPPEAEEA